MERALFINGVYEGVLQEILRIQSELPEHIMYLQPYSGGAIARLRDEPPSLEAPVHLVLSLTSDLPTIHYAAEVVGWSDKRQLSPSKRRVLNRVIRALQPAEKELYDASRAKDGKSANLLYIRRLRRLRKPFSVSKLVKLEDSSPVSNRRMTAGGWTYVRADKLGRLLL